MCEYLLARARASITFLESRRIRLTLQSDLAIRPKTVYCIVVLVIFFFKSAPKYINYFQIYSDINNYLVLKFPL